VADFHSLDVSDGIERAGRAIEGHTQITRAGLCLRPAGEGDKDCEN
jgi:hypothetical protein